MHNIGVPYRKATLFVLLSILLFVAHYVERIAWVGKPTVIDLLLSAARPIELAIVLKEAWDGVERVQFVVKVAQDVQATGFTSVLLVLPC